MGKLGVAPNCRIRSRLARTSSAPAAAIAVVGWDIAPGSDNGSAINWSAPFSGSARQSGDILVVHMTLSNFSNTLPSTPSGWTLIASDRTGSNNPTALYAKVSNGTETTNSWGLSVAGSRLLGIIVRNGTSWTNGACVGDGSSSTSKTPATVNGTSSNDMRLQLVSTNQALGATLSKTGAAWTDAVVPQVSNIHGGDIGIGACYSIGNGASPSFSWSSSGALFWGTSQIVIKP